MDPALTRRLWLTLGGGAAVLCIALLAAFLILNHGPRGAAPPPASTGGLVVQMQGPAGAPIDPQKPLRCFVGGRLVGEETLAACARRNGVATDDLDVGVDQSGQLTAGQQPSASETPSSSAESAAASAAPLAEVAPAGPEGDCLRYVGTAWRKAGAGMSLQGCVKLLFAGFCAKPGAAPIYGRWMAQTLRLDGQAIGISSDDKTFRPLVQQTPSCDIPDF